jgi:hypothetical protein
MAGATPSPANPSRPSRPWPRPARFSNPAKVEKWFKRNCTEVLGRACTPAEKADFIKFVMEDQAS